MTGDALMAVLRTFGPGGATVQQLRRAANAGAEDLDIGLKVLREANRVVILNRHVIIPYTPRMRLDDPQTKPYPGSAVFIPLDHRRCYGCHQIKHEDEFYGNGYCIECGKRASATYREKLALRRQGDEGGEARDAAA